MRLHDLKPRPGAKHRRKRIGFGESSGKGKTAGKGHKGQKARAGSGAHAAFEGGQMPLYRRLPRRGFNNARFHKTWALVNVSTLEKSFEAGATVDEATLREQGFIKGAKWAGLKILGNGDLSKKLTIVADKVSASARTKIEAAGGTIQIVEPRAKPERHSAKKRIAEERAGKTPAPAAEEAKAAKPAKPAKAAKTEEAEKAPAEEATPAAEAPEEVNPADSGEES